MGIKTKFWALFIFCFLPLLPTWAADKGVPAIKSKGEKPLLPWANSPKYRPQKPSKEPQEIRWKSAGSEIQDTNPTFPATWAADWWFAGEVNLYLFQSKISLESGFSVPEISKASIDFKTNDLQINRNEDIFGGEISIGPANFHFRFSYLEGMFRGKGTTTSSFYFHGQNISSGTTLRSHVKVRDIYVDAIWRIGEFVDHPLRPSGRLDMIFGAGYFSIDPQIFIPGRVKDYRDTGFWHLGLEGAVSPVSFVTLKAGFQFGWTEIHDEVTYSNFLIFRTWAGIQINLTRFFHLGLQYRYHLYRVNDDGDYSQFELYGPSFFGSISF